MVKLWSVNFAVAVTLVAGFRLQVVATPEHAPLHPTNVSPGSAMAVSVTRLPVANWAEAEVQAGPQLIAAGLLTTVPRPVPVASFWTVTVTTVPMSSVSAARLLVVSGSVTPAAVTFTTFVTRLVPLPATMLALSTYVALAPEGSVTVVLMLPLPLAPPQLPPPAAVQVQVAPVSWAGSASTTVALVAVAGPALETTIVYWTAWPQAMPPVPSVMVADRFA